MLLLLPGCGTANTNASHPESALESTLEPTLSSVASSAPAADSKLSENLSKMMKESFGTTSWYKYIDKIEVFSNSSGNYANISVTEKPLDCDARLNLSVRTTQSTIDTIVPVVLNSASKLSLDELDVNLISDSLVSILEKESDVEAVYSGLFVYKIPVYKYLADYSKTSESAIRKNINTCVGKTAVAVILAGMTTDYGSTFDGFNMESAKRIAMTANANFKDVALDYVCIRTTDGKLIEKYDAVK